MSCNTYNYSGLADCDALLKKVIGAFVMDKGTTLSDATALATYTAIMAGTASQTGIYLPLNRGYQNNTPDPERNTSNNGFTEKTHDPLPQLAGFLGRTYCDYKTLFDLDGSDKDVVFFLEDGKVWETENSSGTDTGFRVNVTIKKSAAPMADNTAETFPVYFDFKYQADLEKGKIVTPVFNIKELIDAVPVGLNASITSAYAAGDVTVKLVKRCSTTPYTAATATTNWEVLSTVDGSTDLDIAVTAVDATSASLGSYVLTIQRNQSTTPADLASGVVIRAIDDDGSVLTYVSQPLTVSV